MKKNPFVQGAMIATIGVVISKTISYIGHVYAEESSEIRQGQF
jgi:hypothetical protein